MWQVVVSNRKQEHSRIRRMARSRAWRAVSERAVMQDLLVTLRQRQKEGEGSQVNV
jgi:hypothetical protein